GRPPPARPPFLPAHFRGPWDTPAGRPPRRTVGTGLPVADRPALRRARREPRGRRPRAAHRPHYRRNRPPAGREGGRLPARRGLDRRVTGPARLVRRRGRAARGARGLPARRRVGRETGGGSVAALGAAPGRNRPPAGAALATAGLADGRRRPPGIACRRR